MNRIIQLTATSLALVLTTSGFCGVRAGTVMEKPTVFNTVNADDDPLCDQVSAKIEKKDYKGALADCDKMLKRDEKDTWAHFLKGNAYWYLGDMKAAAKEYSVVVRLDPTDQNALENLGAAREELGDWQGALHDFEALIKLDEATGYRRAATIMFDHDDPRAAEYLQKALALCPEDASLKVTKARQYYQEEDYRRALAEVEKGIKLDPEDSYGYLIRAYCYHALDEYAEAVQDCDTAIKLNPTYADAYKQRADSKASNHDLKGSVQDYQKALELSPDDEQILMGLVLTQIRTGDNAGADKTLDKWFAHNEKPHYMGYMMRLTVRLEKRDYAGAFQDFIVICKKLFSGEDW